MNMEDFTKRIVDGAITIADKLSFPLHSIIKSATVNGDLKVPLPFKRRGDFFEMGQLTIGGGVGDKKKRRRERVLPLKALKRLANTDPITWAIRKARRDQISQTKWTIARDTDKLEQELDQWQSSIKSQLNPWELKGFEPYEPEHLDSKIKGEIQSQVKQIVRGSDDENTKKSKLRWLFENAIDKIRYEADQRAEKVIIFNNPCREFPSWNQFVPVVIDDILQFDAGIIVKNAAPKGNNPIAELYTRPGDEILLLRNDDGSVPEPPAVAYIWEFQGRKIADFHDNELMYIMANPQQDYYGMCVHGDSLIETENGKIKAWILVKEKMRVKVRTYNFETKKFEFRSIINWFSRRTKKPCLRIEYGRGGRGWSLRVTDEHPVLTKDGWKKAEDLTISDKIMVKTPTLSREQRQIILGSLLGDASMGPKRSRAKLFRNGNRGYSFPGFSVGHSWKQKDYFGWKVESLSNLVSNITADEQQSPNSNNVNMFHRMSTKKLPTLDSIFKMCYEDRGGGYFRKRITTRWLDKLGELGLAVWFMDDGSIGRNNGKITGACLCTDNFTDEECVVIRDWFRNKLEIDCNIYYSGYQPRIGFKIKETKKLLSLIHDYIEPVFEKKKGRGHGGGTKKWIGKAIKRKGKKEGIIPVAINAIYRENKIENVYDIEVEGNHNFVTGNAVIHNSPLEVVAYVITTTLYVDSYNIDFFKHSNVPPGVLDLGEGVGDETRKFFKNQWDLEVDRTGGLHRMMFMSGSKGVNYIPLRPYSSKDMQMLEYLKWSLAIKSACFQISPQDIGFTMDLHRTTAQVQYEITKDRGLQTLLKLIETHINEEIIKRDYGFTDVKFKYITDTPMDKEREAGMDQIDLQGGIISRNDRRKKIGERPIEGGDVILVDGPSGLVPIEMLDDIAEEMLIMGETGEGETEEQITGPEGAVGTPTGPRSAQSGRVRGSQPVKPVPHLAAPSHMNRMSSGNGRQYSKMPTLRMSGKPNNLTRALKTATDDLKKRGENIVFKIDTSDIDENIDTILRKQVGYTTRDINYGPPLLQNPVFMKPYKERYGPYKEMVVEAVKGDIMRQTGGNPMIMERAIEGALSGKKERMKAAIPTLLGLLLLTSGSAAASKSIRQLGGSVGQVGRGMIGSTFRRTKNMWRIPRIRGK